MIRTLTILLLCSRAALAAGACADGLPRARAELFAARYEPAVSAYREVLKADPQCAAAYDGLVRALLDSHHAAEAYEAARVGMEQVPGMAAGLSANGRALLRKGEIAKAERAWIAAVALDPKEASAVAGLARINGLIAKFKTAQVYRAMAHRLSPDDPKLLAGYAAGLPGPERIELLRTALERLDPGSKEAKYLRAYLAATEARKSKKMNALKSGYRTYQLKLVELSDGPRRLRGYGLRVSFNGGSAATLLLDTGASGISLAPRLAEKFGLEQMATEGLEVGGIGDGARRALSRYVAASVKVGDLEMGDVPVEVFDTAKSPDFDGLIGADTFARFLVTLDFPNRSVELTPFAKEDAPSDETKGPRDSVALPAGLSRMYRTGHMLLVPAMINTAAGHLLLIDSGASVNLIDRAVARETTKTVDDAFTTIKGVQGKVKNVARADVTLQFANLRQKNPELVAVDLTDMSDNAGLEIAGILGMPVLNNLKVTIDYRDNGISFEYKPR